MKKFLMYLIVLVVCLFVGFTTYYAVQNKESFALVEIQAGGYICINVEDSKNIGDILVHERPYKTTTVKIESSNPSVVEYIEGTNTIYATSGGVSTITITTSNKNYGPYIFDVYVGDGSEGNPYYISSASQLVNLVNEDVNNKHYYKLISDLDLRLYNQGVWQPLPEFNGNFNGNNHTISNLNITGKYNNAGLFASLSSTAVVENLILKDVSIDGEFNNAGAVAGVNYGFIGKCSVNNITLVCSKGNNGGIVGYNAYAENKASVSMCEVKNITFNVLGETSVLSGGIVGFAEASSIINCQSIVANYTSSNESAIFGGIVGSIKENLTNQRVFILKNNFAIIRAFDNDKIVSGIVGSIDSTLSKNLISNNYYYTSVTENSLTGLYGCTDVASNYKALSNSQISNQANYNGFNFEDVWAMNNNSSYAILNLDGIYQYINVYENGKDITNSEEFMSAITDMENSAGKEFKITASEINFEGRTFSGGVIAIFEGKLYSETNTTIKNITINADDYSNVGFIMSNKGTLENITFENITIIGNSDKEVYLGIVTGNNKGIIKNVKVVNSKIEGQYANIGGIVGNNLSTIEQSSFNGTLVGSGKLANIGGIAGVNYQIVKNCSVELSQETITYTAPNTPSSEYINLGGVVGLNNSKVDGCTSLAEIICTGMAKLYVGGVVGKNNANAVVSYSYFGQNGSIQLNDNNKDSYLGGVVGMNGAKAIVKTSGNDAIIEGTNVAGVVCNNYGTVQECYAGSGKSSGIKVGGIVCNNYGSGSDENPNLIVNCYTTQMLDGTRDSAVLSGLVSYLGYQSKIQNCFGAAQFGKGTAYAESASEFRFVLTEKLWDYPKWLINKLYEYINLREKVGVYEHSIITNYGTAKIQSKYAIIERTGDTFAEVTDEQFVSGDYKNIFTDNGFQTNIWTGISKNENNYNYELVNELYPTLKNAYYPEVEEIE